MLTFHIGMPLYISLLSVLSRSQFSRFKNRKKKKPFVRTGTASEWHKDSKITKACIIIIHHDQHSLAKQPINSWLGLLWPVMTSEIWLPIGCLGLLHTIVIKGYLNQKRHTFLQCAGYVTRTCLASTRKNLFVLSQFQHLSLPVAWYSKQCNQAPHIN